MYLLGLLSEQWLNKALRRRNELDCVLLEEYQTSFIQFYYFCCNCRYFMHRCQPYIISLYKIVFLHNQTKAMNDAIVYCDRSSCYM